MAKKTTKKTTTKRKTTTKKAPAKAAPRKSASAARAEGGAKTKRALGNAKKTVASNLKAIAAADQENAKKRDARKAAPDGLTASDQAMARSAKPRRTKKAPKADTRKKRVSGLDIAATVLAKASEPLSAKTIAERAIAAGWKTTGKTPEATLYAAIIREIAKKGKDARFKKTDRGRFTATGKGA